jgi:hypothetical protein
MAWETRARGGLYYTRSRKVGGNVVREYIGRGEVAKAIATLDAADREERRERAEALRAEIERFDQADAGVRVLCDLADLLARDTLQRAGYHQHDRGDWRRKRE